MPLVLPDTTWSCANEPATLNAGAHYETYRWSTGASDSTVQVTQSGYYEVTVSSRCGQQRAGTWVVRSTPEEGFVPNIITPNGDGLNDTFVLDEHLRGSPLHVYNRWRKLVYAHPTYQNAWDGDGLPGGVYFYTIDHPCLGESRRGMLPSSARGRGAGKGLRKTVAGEQLEYAIVEVGLGPLNIKDVGGSNDVAHS